MGSNNRAVEFDGALRVIERDTPKVAEDEVLIKLRLAGICSTDLELMQGYKGFRGLLGHEFVGDVVAGPPEWMGRRVVGEINIGCGTCDMCLKGVVSHCRVRRVLGLLDYDGAFADVFRLPARNLYAVPDMLSDDQAVFTEPLAAACQILEVAPIKPSDRVIVIGAGRLGLLAAQVLRLTGADVSVIVRHERPAGLLAGWGIPAVARESVTDNQAAVVVDCTGSAQGFAASLDMVKPRGTIVLKSTFHGMPQVDLTRIAVEEIRVVGSRCGPFPVALRLLTGGLVDVLSMIDARYLLDNAPTALEHASRPGVLKVLLAP